MAKENYDYVIVFVHWGTEKEEQPDWMQLDQRKGLEEAGAEAFTIIGLEQKVRGEIDGFRFKGFVDRMDSYKGGEVRIVDYKTGRVSEEES